MSLVTINLVIVEMRYGVSIVIIAFYYLALTTTITELIMQIMSSRY